MHKIMLDWRYDGFLVSKETACGAASVGEMKTKMLVLSNELIKVELPP